MSLPQSASAKITALATAITNLITTHYNLTGSSQQKGHVQAGSTPQAIGSCCLLEPIMVFMLVRTMFILHLLLMLKILMLM